MNAMLHLPSHDRCRRGAPPQRTTSSTLSDWAALAPCRRSPTLPQPTTRIAPPYSRVPVISRTWHAITSCTRYLPQLDLRQSLPLAAECDRHSAGGSEARNHYHHWCQALVAISCRVSRTMTVTGLVARRLVITVVTGDDGDSRPTSTYVMSPSSSSVSLSSLFSAAS